MGVVLHSPMLMRALLAHESSQKETGVIFTIRRMGLIEMAHWVSWLLVLSVLNVLSSALVAAITPAATKNQIHGSARYNTKIL